MKRRRFLAAAAAAAPALAGFRPLPRREPYLVERWSWAMGQPVRLRLFHQNEDAGRVAAQAALAELRRVERVLSRFDGESELNHLHQYAGRGWLRVSPELSAVLAAGARWRAQTAGAFDLAVEPLMRAWGFREPRKAAPGERELAAARAALASAVVERSGDRVRLPAAHTRLDPGGIGVGFGLDQAGAVLRSAGIGAALLEVSGDLLAIGRPPGTPGWTVDLVDPRGPGLVLTSVLLADAGLATSAQTASVAELSGRRLGHVMDPARGAPAERALQATVVAPTALEADVLSTASLVLGHAAPGATRCWMVR